MRLHTSETVDLPIAPAARETMARLGIPDTPRNFEVWYTYYSGIMPTLNQTIDALLSSGQEFTNPINEEIFELFLGSAYQHQVIRETTERLFATAQAIHHVLNTVGENANALDKTPQDPALATTNENPLNGLFNSLMSQIRTIEDHSQQLQERALYSSITIDKLRRNFEEAQHNALTDALTGIANRKMFELTLRQAAKLAIDTGSELSLLMFDIDRFKDFNDRWGHQTGDEVLKMVAETIARNLKENCTAARYGGEEFVAILCETDLDHAMVIGEAIRKSIASRTFAEPTSQRSLGRVTVSVGAALFARGETLASFVSRTDKALYAAKRLGRNLVTAA